MTESRIGSSTAGSLDRRWTVFRVCSMEFGVMEFGVMGGGFPSPLPYSIEHS